MAVQQSTPPRADSAEAVGGQPAGGAAAGLQRTVVAQMQQEIQRLEIEVLLKNVASVDDPEGDSRSVGRAAAGPSPPQADTGRYDLALRGDSIGFLDSATGEEPGWSKTRCFRTLALPAGTVSHQSMMRWVQTAAADTDEGGLLSSAPSLLLLQASVDSQLYTIDVSAFIRAFASGGNFSVEQLNCLADISPDAIPTLVAKWRQVINLRDESTGNSVLHYCAMPDTKIWGKGIREGHGLKPRAIAKKWLREGLSYVPMENKAGMSALRVAVDNGHVGIAEHLAIRLNPHLDLKRTGSITNDLVFVAETWPHLLVRFIRLLDGTACEPPDKPVDKLYHHLRHVYHPTANLEGSVVRGSSTCELYTDRTDNGKSHSIVGVGDKAVSYTHLTLPTN